MSLSTGATLGAAGVFGSAALGQSGQGVYVNAATGNLVIQARDDLLMGRGPDAGGRRTYNGQNAADFDNGDYWTPGLARLFSSTVRTPNTVGSTVTRTDDDGSTELFTYNTTLGKYLSTEGGGAFDTLTYNSSDEGWTFVDGRTQRIEVYSSTSTGGRLLSVTDQQGNSLTYAYSSGRLATVTTDAGEITAYTYDGNGRLQDITTHTRSSAGSGLDTTLRRVTYGYDTAGRLQSVTVDLTPQITGDSQVFVTSYAYEGTSHRLASITQSDGVTLAFTYEAIPSSTLYRVKTVLDSVGGSALLTFTYDTVTSRTTVTDAQGRDTVYVYDSQSQLTEVKTTLPGGTVLSTQYAYNANGDVSTITDGEGRHVQMEYDGWGNLIRQYDDLTNTVRRTYNAQNQLLTETVATLGDPPTSAQASRFVYDASGTLLRFAITAEGRVTEHRYDTDGQRTATIRYTGLTYTVSGLSFTDVPALSQMESWASSSQSGQDLTRTERVDYTYDWRGQLSTSKSYAAVNSSGNGIVDGTEAVTHYVYSSAGQLLQTISPRNKLTQYAYDGLGRLLTSTNALNQVTTNVYDETNHVIQTTADATGLRSTSHYDSRGRVDIILQEGTRGGITSFGQSEIRYDADGRAFATRDATGQWQWSIYDAAGRKVGAVSAQGLLQEYVYDRSGKLTQTVDYSTPLGSSVLMSGSAPVLLTLSVAKANAGTAYRASWNAYDGAGRLVKTVSPMGEVTEFAYDPAGRVTSTKRYANTISTSGLGSNPAPGAINPTPSGADRIERNFYGHDGLLLATLDATGGLVQYSYDAAGRATTRIDRVSVTTEAQVSSPPAAEGDSRTLTFYNARGQVVAELDALKYLTERIYDRDGNLTDIKRYPTQPVSGTVDPTTALGTLQANAGTARVQTRYEYDDINRVLTQWVDPDGLNISTSYVYSDLSNKLTVTDPLGVKTETLFDELGRVKTVKVDSASGGLALLTQYTYDNLGRVLTGTDPKGVVTAYSYDALGRRKTETIDPGTGSHLNLVTTYTYDRQGNLARVVDAKGQQTRYFYDKDNRLVQTLDAEFGLTENRYDALGNLVEVVRYAARQTNVLTSDIGNGLIENSLSSVTSSSTDRHSRYVYDASGRQRFAIDALGNVTESRYDAAGQVTATLHYDRAFSLGSTPTEASVAAAVLSFESLARVGRFVHDAAGQLVYELDALGAVTSYRYDADGRVLESTRHANRIPTSTALTASAFATALQPFSTAKDRLSRFVYDAAGRNIYAQDAGGGVTEFRYDKLGQLAERVQYNYQIPITTALTSTAFSTALSGHASASLDRLTRFVYDAAGRLRYEQDAIGAVVEYRYDAVGQVAERVAYASTISPATALQPGTFSTALGAVADSLRDRTTRYVYDDAGRLVYQQDALGGVTEMRYDALGQLIERIERANRVSTATALTSGAFSGVVTSSAHDRKVRYVYDKIGEVRFTVDALGGAVENVYDALGQLARVVAYDTALSYGSVSDGSTPQNVRDLLPSGTLGARETVYAYDLSGQRVYAAQSTSAGLFAKSFAVTRSTYDSFGQVTLSKAYANTVVLSGLGQIVTTTEIGSLIVDNGTTDRTTQYDYFNDGRLKSTTDGENNSESFTYDAVGNKRSYTNRNGTVTDYDYDLAGRLTEEKSAEVSVATVSSGMVVSSSLQHLTTKLEYSTFGDLIARTEAYGLADARTTRYVYDRLGHQTRTEFEQVRNYDSTADNLSTNGQNGAAITRHETALVTLFAETAYNTFGEAVIGVDVTGKFSYKTHDRLGRLVNEVDGNHNVTRHEYSTVDGEYSDLMRLASAASIADGWSVTAADLDTAVGAVLSGGVRNVRTYTDRMGRVSSVQDLAGAYSYDSATASGGTWTRVNSYGYTVWGELDSKTTTVNGSGASAVTRNRYDLAGRLIREINAEGYVTDYKKTAFGDNERITEYATKLTGSDPDAMPASVLPSTAADAPSYDRITEYKYDRRGKNVREEKLFVQFDKRTSAGALSRVWGKVFTTYEFDGAGNLQVTGRGSQEDGSSTVVDGGTSYQYYDVLGRLLLTRDAANRATSMAYDALGEVVRTTRHGNFASSGSAPGAHADDQITIQRRDKLGRVMETLEPEGLRRYFSYDAAGRVAKQWTPFADTDANTRNAVQLFTYDAAGRQLTTKTLIQRLRTDSLDYSVEAAQYNAFGEVELTQRDGTTIQRNWYDAGGRLWKTSSAGTTKVFWYDLQDNLTVTFSSSAGGAGVDLDSTTWTGPASFASLTLANGVARRTTTYDRLGRSTGESDSGSTHAGTIRTTSASQTVDRWGNVLGVTRNGVERLRYRYNVLNEVISEKQVAADVWTSSGTNSTIDVEKKIYYDGWGRNIGSVDGENNLNSATYDNVGQLQTEYRADGSTVSYVYDALGRMVNKTDGIGRLYTYVYDGGNRERSRTVTTGGVTYDLGSSTYDVLGRKITETTGADSAFQGKTRKYDYDARGLMWRSAMPMGQTTLMWYDNAGRKEKEQDANGQFATWVYSQGTGLLSYHLDLSAIRTDYAYNELGLLETQTSVRGQSLSYVYFEDGRLKQLSDLYRRSNTQYDYDVDGNRTREVFTSDGVIHRDLTNAYDTQGRLTNSVDVAYSGAGVPTSVPSIHEFSVRYDAVGNRKHLWGSTADDFRVGNRGTYDWWYTYDGMNRVRINGGRLVSGVIKADSEFVYDAAGRRTWDWARFTGTNYQPTSMSGYRMEYAYDFADRLTERKRTLLLGQSHVLAGTSTVEQTMSYNSTAGTQSEVINWFSDGIIGQVGLTIPGSVLYKDRLSVTQFDANGRVASVSEKEQGFAVTIPGGGGSTGQHGYVDLSKQVNTYDAASNLSKVQTEGYTPTQTNPSRWQVYDTYKSSAFDYRYTYYLAESYLERGQNLQGQLFNQNGSSAGFLTPTDSVQEYDANGNVAQIKRQKSNGTWTSTWYVTDNVGHIVQSWANQARYWNGVAGTIFSQDATQRIWAPDASTPLSGTATAMAAMPSPALTLDPVEWNKLTVLFVNDQKLGLFQAGVQWENVPREPIDPPEDPPEQQLRSYWNGMVDIPGLGTIDRAAGSGQQHVAQAGDTASSLAQRYYGDPGLWYVIADANSQGQVNGPYAELAPGTAVKIPAVARSTNTANSFAVYQPSQIIGVTAPEAQMPPPPAAGGCGTVGVILVVAIAVVATIATAGAAAAAMGASGGGIMSLGASVLAGTATTAGFGTGAMLAAAAVGGAVGSIAGQTVAMSLGMQEGFNWKQVGLSALGAAVGSGIGKVGSSLSGLNEHPMAWRIGSAAAGSAVTQRVAVATGLQESFNWRSVAASAAAAPVADFIGEMLTPAAAGLFGEGTLLSKTALGIVRGVAGQRVRMLVTKQGRVDYSSIAADAFGNALAGSIAMQMQSGGVDWAAAPDQSEAESARLERSGNRYAAWPDETDAETQRLARQGNPYAYWPDETGAERARLDRTGNRYAYWPDETAAEANRLTRYAAAAGSAERRAAREAQWVKQDDEIMARRGRETAWSFVKASKASLLQRQLDEARAADLAMARLTGGASFVPSDGVVRLPPAHDYLARTGQLAPNAGTIEAQVGPTVAPAVALTFGGGAAIAVRGAFAAWGAYDVGFGAAAIGDGNYLSGGLYLTSGLTNLAGAVTPIRAASLETIERAGATTFWETVGYTRDTSRLVLDQRVVTGIGEVACGPTACAMILGDRGLPFNIVDLAAKAKIQIDGTDVYGLTNALKDGGVSAARWANKVTIDQIADATAKGHAAIVQVDAPRGSHFVVVDGITTRPNLAAGQLVAIRDPWKGTQYFSPVNEFSSQMTKGRWAVFTNPVRP